MTLFYLSATDFTHFYFQPEYTSARRDIKGSLSKGFPSEGKEWHFTRQVAPRRSLPPPSESQVTLAVTVKANHQARQWSVLCQAEAHMPFSLWIGDPTTECSRWMSRCLEHSWNLEVYLWKEEWEIIAERKSLTGCYFHSAEQSPLWGPTNTCRHTLIVRTAWII